MVTKMKGQPGVLYGLRAPNQTPAAIKYQRARAPTGASHMENLTARANKPIVLSPSQ